MLPQDITVGLGGNPFVVTVSPDDRRVYVTIGSSNIVQVVDASTNAVIKSITVGGSGPNGLAWSSDGSRLYVSNTVSPGTITEIDATSDVVLRTFATGGKPQGMAVSRDGRELYVADESRNMLDVWALVSGTRTSSIPLGGGGFDLQLSPDNAEIWIGLAGQGKVLVFDRATRQLLQTIITGGTPRRIAFDLFGTTAIVANETSNAVHFMH